MSSAARVIAAALILCLAGCGRASHVYLRAEPGINPGTSNEPRPVNVKLFQLKTIEAFKTAEWDPLWTDPAAALGDSLVGAPLEVTVQPGDGQDTPYRLQLGPWAKDATSLGVMALFSKPLGTDESGSVIDRRRVVVSAWHANDYVIELTAKNELHFRKH